MKATKFISACAVLAALASCSNEHELSQQSAEDTPIRIQANVGGITTRAASNIQGGQFDAGEKIGIFLKEYLTTGQTKVANYSNPIEGTVNSTTQTKIDLGSTQYFPSNGHGVDCLAIYPMKIGSTNIDEKITSFSVEEDQSNADEYKASDLMYAYTENTPKGNDINLTFKHLLSKIIVEVVADASSVSQSVLSDVYVDLLKTNKTIDITVNDIAQGTPSSAKSVTVGTNPSDQKTINLGHPTYTSGNQTGEVAAIIVPQTISSSSNGFIQVRLNKSGADYATYTYTPNANLTFEGSKSYKYTITIKAGSISVSNVTITDWGNGTPDLPGGNGNGDAYLD